MLHVPTFEHVHLPEGRDAAGHVHAHAHACLVLDGALLDAPSGGREVDLARGVVRLCAPGTSHHLEAPAGGADCIVLEWPMSVDVGAQGGFVRAPRLAALGRRAVADIENAYTQAGRNLVAMRLAAAVRRALNVGDAAKEPAWVQESMDEIVSGDATSIAALARRAGVHRATLSAGLREYRGAPPRVLRRHVMLERAGACLSHDMPAAQAAAEAGFSDQAHLTRAWRAAFRSTPGRWISRARDKRSIRQS